MIVFRHHGNRHEVRLGQLWSDPENKADTYRDTTASELLQIIREIKSGEPWRACVERHYAGQNSWLHRIVTDPARDLFFRLHPPLPSARVLDIGAGWGQITLPLARKNQVTAVEPTAERLAFIQVAARQDGTEDSIAFLEADFMDVEFECDFELACCIGVLEWVPKFRVGTAREVQKDFLAKIKLLLAPGGKLVVGIENRLGLKYILGAPDDHIGLPGISVLEASVAEIKYRAQTGRELRSFTYSLAEYRQLFSEAGFKQIETHLAFPDYKLPALICSAESSSQLRQHIRERRLPAEHDGINGQPLPNQDVLDSHYRSLSDMDLVQAFAPSFYFVLE